jgi:molybdopterin-guanine dinucleotide biosynthesis protein A
MKNPAPDFPFSALLLVGGRSIRFGSDKALQVLPGHAEPLWSCQLTKLRAVGPAECLLSAGCGGPSFAPPPDVRTVRDAVPDQGPLAGLAAGLAAARTPWVLVLAVDLPGVGPEDLRELLNRCGGEASTPRGVVPFRDGRWEPLCAVYPRTLAGLAASRLAAGRRALQGFVDEAEAGGAVLRWPMEPGPDTERRFRNVNRPEDADAASGPFPGVASGPS